MQHKFDRVGFGIVCFPRSGSETLSIIATKVLSAEDRVILTFDPDSGDILAIPGRKCD
jgi:hypothetical protein